MIDYRPMYIQFLIPELVLLLTHNLQMHLDVPDFFGS